MEPIKIPSSNDFSLSNNEATPTPTPQSSSPPPIMTKKPFSPINTSKFSVLGSIWSRSWRPWVKQTREEIACRKFLVTFVTQNQHNHCLENEIVWWPHMEPIRRQHEVVTPPKWTWYEYVHTLFAEYVALPQDAIVALDIPCWMRPVYPKLVKMSPQWWKRQWD